MAEITGGELVAESLLSQGVTHAFGVHGGHLDSMLEAMARSGITLVDTRHEAAAGHAAEAWSRTTGGIGACFVTSGPGFTNGYTALANAHLDRIPMLMLTSSPPTREAGLNVLQGGFDQVEAARPVTRWATRVDTTARIPDLVAHAVRVARSSPPGPVLVELPINVLFRGVDESLVTSAAPVPIEAPAPSPQAVARVLDLLGKAARPVVVVGGGAALSTGARQALETLLGSTTIPIVASSWGHGMLPADHPCLLGGLTELATLPMLVEAPDFVLLLGARRGIFLGGRGTSMIPEGATVVQVDIDGAEPGRLPVALGVQADVGELLRSLGSAASDATLPDWSEWNEATKAAQGAIGILYSEADPITASGRIHPYVVSQRVAEALDPDGILVYDGGESSAWINGFARAGRPGSWFGNGYLGALGVGPGLAIGA
jgi:acetolactate synthase-1/2/3 large subunit